MRIQILLFLALTCTGLLADDKDGTGFVSIFDGKTLQGWRAEPKSDAAPWSVKDGVIHGEGKEDRQAYLIYAGDEKLEDFELNFSYRLLTKGNTGVEVRARIDETGKRQFEGYHADLGHVGIGDGILGAWDFHFGKGKRKEFPCQRGQKLVIDKQGEAKHSQLEKAVQVSEIKKRDWNRCKIVAKGNRFQFFINGKIASEFVDNKKDGCLRRGFIGLQLHDKGMIVQFKELKLKKLEP